MKKIKLFALCLISFAFVFTSCNKDDDNDNGDDASVYTINVKMTEAAPVEIDSVFAVLYYEVNDYNWTEEVIGRTAYNNGNFSISLPATLENKYLVNIQESFRSEAEDDIASMPNHVNTEEFPLAVSDPNAMVLNGELMLNAYKDGVLVGFIMSQKVCDFMGYPMNVYGSYLYVDRAITITGEYAEEVEMMSGRVIFNCSFNKGWNLAFQNINYNQSSSEIVFEMEVNNVQGLEWVFRDEDSYSFASGIKRTMIKK